MADFNDIAHPRERSEGTADTVRALNSKTRECVLDVFRTEYKTILCDSNPKLG